MTVRPLAPGEDRLLSSTGDRAYEEAVEYLEKIQALMKRAKKADMFAAVVCDLRAVHAHPARFQNSRGDISTDWRP